MNAKLIFVSSITAFIVLVVACFYYDYIDNQLFNWAYWVLFVGGIALIGYTIILKGKIR